MAGRRVDFHHHMMPPAYLKEAGDKVVATAGGFISVLDWTPEASLAAMDEAGIDAAVLTMATPGIWFGDDAQAARLARICAEFGAAIAQAHPRRFAYLAPLPLPDVAASLRAIDEGFDRFGADGVCLLSSYGDTWLGDPAFDRVFAALNARRAVVFVHPTTPDRCKHIVRGLPDPILEFLFDSTRAITNLLYSGTLLRCPDIRFVFTHGGAALPGLAHRIGHAMTRMPQFQKNAPDGAASLLSRLHFDMANSGSAIHLAALARLVPPENVLYGSDFPFMPVGETVDQLRQAGMDEAGLDRIAGANAFRLIPRLA